MSMQLVKVGRRQCLVVSDDSASSETGSPRPGFEKLFEVGERSLCGIVGQLALWPCEAIADRIVKLSLIATLRDRPRAFLEALKTELHAPFARMFADEPSRFQWLLPDTQIFFVAFCLTRERTGDVDLLELRFPLCNLEGPVLGEPEIITHMEREIPRGTYCYNLGPKCLVNDPLNPLDLDSSDDAILCAVEPMISGFKQADAVCREEIGELISVAAIDSAGFRWLRNATPPAVREPIEDPPVRGFRACARVFRNYKNSLTGKASA